MVMRYYACLEAFYNSAPPAQRRYSPELDFGVHWTDLPLPGEIPAALPRWRVSWIEHTGEVYAARDAGGPVRVYGRIHGRNQIEVALDGWARHCGGRGSLWWLEQRMDAFGRVLEGDDSSPEL
jgi:hypothetical protein